MRKALEVWKQVQVDFHDLPEDRAELSRIHHWLGNLLFRTSRLTEAERELRLALTLREEMVANGPVPPDLAARLAHIKLYLAHLKLWQGDLGESERYLPRDDRACRAVEPPIPARGRVRPTAQSS